MYEYLLVEVDLDDEDSELILIAFFLSVAAADSSGVTEALDTNVTAINTIATTISVREPRSRIPFFFI